jgi:hypothetical protein
MMFMMVWGIVVECLFGGSHNVGFSERMGID